MISFITHLPHFQQLALAIMVAFILCGLYESARLIGVAQSGDIDWKDYEPWANEANAKYNADEDGK